MDTNDVDTGHGQCFTIIAKTIGRAENSNTEESVQFKANRKENASLQQRW